MTHNWLAVTHLDDEEFERLSSERMLADAATD
jgi:hypothetical protein